MSQSASVNYVTISFGAKIDGKKIKQTSNSWWWWDYTFDQREKSHLSFAAYTDVSEQKNQQTACFR